MGNFGIPRDLELALAGNLIGMHDLVDYLTAPSKAASYPPYNIKRVHLDEAAEDRYHIEIALAGWKRDDIDIQIDRETLVISGKSEKPEDYEREECELEKKGQSITYSHRGIAMRDFELRFRLAPYYVVDEASFEDGLLSIACRQELPEHLKPRKIEIGAKRPTLEAVA